MVLECVESELAVGWMVAVLTACFCTVTFSAMLHVSNVRFKIQ
jgi:hypothetical protein